MFNDRTLLKTSRLLELVNCAKQQYIDILSIQEHRLFYPDTEIELKTSDGYQLMTSSAWRNDQGSTIKQLSSVEKISSCIELHNSVGKTKTTVITCYSPTNVSNKLDQDLKSVTENIPAHNLLVVAGDFNAQIGPEDMPFTDNKETNCNREKLLYAEEFQQKQNL